MTTKPTARVDLHLHTKYSRRAADWLLRRLDFPASYTDPKQACQQLREAGMDFITFTDENTIEGCLEVADQPGVFLSEEVVACFPEDGCRVNILVWGLSEAQHPVLQELKGNIYELQRYLVAEGLAHAVAHPLHSTDEKLTSLHFQKLVLLFRHFETLNGRYNALLSEAASAALTALTPESIARCVEATGLEPTHEEPWKKVFVGGSDDHGGVFPARAFTVTPAAGTAEDFLQLVKDGQCHPEGEGGTPLAMAHGTYSTAFEFAKARLSMKPEDPGTALLEKIFSRFMEGKDPTEFSLGEKIGFLAQGIATGKIFEMAKAGKNSLWKELSAYFSKPEIRTALARETAGVEEPERRAFLMANLLANQLGYRFFSQFIAQINSGKFLESIQMITPLVPILALLGPYYHAFRLPSRQLLRRICADLNGQVPDCLKNEKRAWFTDTLEDVNGVSTTIRRMTAAGVAQGRDIMVLTSRSEITVDDIPIENFPPIGEFELPEYELQRLSFPPVLQMMDFIERGRYSELIISTPGPVGLTALLAAKLLGLQTSSIYHTDFPQYVGILTDDSFMETLTWNFMHWFYSQTDLVYVNSEDYRRCWVQRGIPDQQLRILPRGLDTLLFHPSRRDEAFWRDRGLLEGETGVLYVGRISKEKNLDILVAASREIERKKLPVRLLFVGDGPYAKEIKRLLPGALFTGYLAGEELARAYASADLFAFPSTTDTFGNVILEAQASGIPCIVSDTGGPRDLVTDGEDGYVVRSHDVSELASSIEKLSSDPALRRRLGQAARMRVEDRDWSRAFEQFWQTSTSWDQSKSR